MPITFSYHIVTVATVATIVAGLHGPTRPEGSASAHARVTAAQDAVSAVAQAAAVRYWTPARMAAAPHRAAAQPPGPRRSLVRRPVSKTAPAAPWLTGDTAGSGLRWTHRGAVAAAVGKVFFTLDGAGYVCSGTLVGGERAKVVVTAAHCAAGGAKPGGAADLATNWVFVPGFRDGRMPYGEYTARRFFVAPEWSGPSGGSEQYDVAFVQVGRDTLHGRAQAAPPSGLPVEFSGSQDAAPAHQAYVFGYPSLPPYSGLHPDYCAGPVAAADGSVRTSCGMTAGDSGGPWLARFSPLTGTGTVTAVTTYKISDDLSVLYGAVLGPQARALYARASA